MLLHKNWSELCVKEMGTLIFYYLYLGNPYHYLAHQQYHFALYGILL